MSSSIRYGFLGCGMMGQEHIRNVSLIAGAKVNVNFEPNEKMRSESSLLAPQARIVKTEEEVMDSIRNLSEGKTILFVAHRLSTLNFCDRILKIEKGSLKQV